MGQRLNIEIKENEKTLANAYYHWSAYTDSSLGLTEHILKNIDFFKHENNIINAIRLLETTGAGLTFKEKALFKKDFADFENIEFEECTGRNDGLIAISESGIRDTRSWEEGRVEIDLTNKTVNFNVVWKETLEEIKEDYPEVSIDDINVLDINFENITFDNFSKFKTELINLIENEIYRVKTKDSEIIYNFVQ